jgi:hypothetical protein
MDKPPTKAKPSAEAEEAPDEVDADAKPSAFEAEAKALDDRLRQLTGDYAALFLRYPNVEGRHRRDEVLEKMQVLGAIRVHPWRKKMADEASKFERAAFGEGQHVFLQMWIDGVSEILERGDWDVAFAARNLITTLPAPLRLKCPGYPAAEDRHAFAAATAAVANKIRDKVNKAAAAVSDSEPCQESDAIAIGRLALAALGYEGARHNRLLGSSERRPKV